MMKTMISQYVRTLFNESRDGELTAGDLDDRFDYLVEWDEETAEALAQECGTLVGHLTELSHQFEKLQCRLRRRRSIWRTVAASCLPCIRSSAFTPVFIDFARYKRNLCIRSSLRFGFSTL